MAEENQPTKRHKPSNTHTEHDISQASPIRDDLDSQIPIPIGEEENKREADENDQSERERNTFLDTDVRKSLDDKLQFITGSLPKFEHQHALVSSQLLSDIERIEDPKDKNQAFQYLRVALKNAFPLLKESTDTLDRRNNPTEAQCLNSKRHCGYPQGQSSQTSQTHQGFVQR